MNTHPGIGAMLHILGGGSKEDPSKYTGKTISSISLQDVGEIYSDDLPTYQSLKIIFTDGTTIVISDQGQSCCETRYMRTDDDLQSIVGGTIIKIEGKEGPSIEAEYEEHEICFVEIQTDKGFITLANHNEHNGYYGGFGMNISELP